MSLGNARVFLYIILLWCLMVHICSSCNRSFPTLVGRTHHYKYCSARRTRIAQICRRDDPPVTQTEGGSLQYIRGRTPSAKIPRTDLAGLAEQREWLRQVLHASVSIQTYLVRSYHFGTRINA